MWTMELIIIAMMIIFNSIFAAYEIALASIRQSRLAALAAEKRRGAAAALRMKSGIEASLAVVQLGITLVGAVAAATGGAGAEESLGPLLREWGFSPSVSQLLAVALVVAPLTVITIIVGELVPKVFALRNQEWVCLKLSPPMEWFAYSVWPAVWILENTVNLIVRWGEKRRGESYAGDAALDAAIQEIRGAASVARMSRLISHHEEGIIISASRLSKTPLSKVMLPAEYIGMLVADMGLSEALIVAHQEMHTRFPVTEQRGNPQRIIGYVNFKDIVVALRVSPHVPSLRNLIRQLRSFSEETSVAMCLEGMIRERNHIAIIKNRQAEVVGLITLEDIVEELVGEIHDEFDRMPTYLIPTTTGWIAGGFVSLNDLRDKAQIDLPALNEKPIYTLNDWIAEQLDQPPQGGDEIIANGYRVVVRKTRHVLVQEASIDHLPAANGASEETAE